MRLQNAQVGIENEWAPDSTGWVRLARYGEHPKVRLVQEGSGLRRETWIQVLDRPGSERLAASFNGLFGTLQRAFKSAPVYVGHPDLAKHAPESGAALGNMTPVGAVGRLEARDDGLYAQLNLFDEGQAAVANEGMKKLSPLWIVETMGTPTAGDPIRCRPVRLISVALTDRPNLSGGEALANHERTPEGLTSKPGTGALSAPCDGSPTDITMKHLLIGLLAAQGITLANEATDDAVFARINERLRALADQGTTLANEKAHLAGRVTALESDLTAEKTARTKSDTDLVAAQTALGNERKAHAGAVVDLAIAQGKVAVADRDARIQLILSAADFSAAAAALANEAPKHKTTGSATGDRRADANNTPATAARQVTALANELIRTGKAKDWDDAWKLTEVSHPALHEQMAAKAS